MNTISAGITSTVMETRDISAPPAVLMGNYTVIALAMVVNMLVYLSAALNRGWLSSGKSLYWISSKNW